MISGGGGRANKRDTKAVVAHVLPTQRKCVRVRSVRSPGKHARKNIQ